MFKAWQYILYVLSLLDGVYLSTLVDFSRSPTLSVVKDTLLVITCFWPFIDSLYHVIFAAGREEDVSQVKVDSIFSLIDPVGGVKLTLLTKTVR
jgi:hypothetical protein